MSDDQKNDELMSKFIESAVPKLLEALTPKLTEHVESQIAGFKEHATKLLDEVKDARRAAQQHQPTFKKGEPIQLTRQQARDPQTYRAAKKQAAEAGVPLQIVSED